MARVAVFPEVLDCNCKNHVVIPKLFYLTLLTYNSVIIVCYL